MKKMYCFFFIGFLFLLSCNKTKKPDDKALNKEIAFLQKEFLRVLKTHKDSTFFFLNKQNELISNQIQDTLKQENWYQNGVYHYKIAKDVDSAFYFFEKAISLSKDSMTSKRELNYYYNLAKYYREQKKTEDALYTLNRFKSILNKKKDLKELGYIYNLKSQIFENIGAIDSAYMVNQNTINNFKLLKDTTNMIVSSIIKINLKKLDNQTDAIMFLDSLSNLKKEKSYYLKYFIASSKGDVYYYHNKNIKKASKFYLKGYLDISKSIRKDKNVYKLRVANRYLKTLLKLNDLKTFNSFLQQVDSLNVKKYTINDFKEYLKNKLYFSYLKNKDFSVVEKELDSFYDNLLKEVNRKKESKFSALEKAAKRERNLLITKQKIALENRRLEKQKIMLFSFLGLLLLSIVILILWLQKRKIKQSRDELFMQQRLFRAQMNPHFTSNVLFSIQILLKKDPQKTEQYLLKFSRLLRVILENSTKNYVSIETEVEALQKYMDLQQLRFNNRFDYQINIADSIEQDMVKIPPMLIQPFVENAIEHGFKNIDYKGKIVVSLQLETNFIQCVIKDNGVGLLKNQPKSKISSTALLKDLIKKMTGFDMQIESTNKGLTVRFKIPFIEEL